MGRGDTVVYLSPIAVTAEGYCTLVGLASLQPAELGKGVAPHPESLALTNRTLWGGVGEGDEMPAKVCA